MLSGRLSVLCDSRSANFLQEFIETALPQVKFPVQSDSALARDRAIVMAGRVDQKILQGVDESGRQVKGAVGAKVQRAET